MYLGTELLQYVLEHCCVPIDEGCFIEDFTILKGYSDYSFDTVSTLRSHSWRNGREGIIVNDGDNFEFRFIPDKDEFFETYRRQPFSEHRLPLGLLKRYQFIAGGIIGYWICHHLEDISTTELFTNYYEVCKNKYNEEHKQDFTEWSRTLDEEFAVSYHIKRELELIKESEAIFDFVSKADKVMINSLTSNYLAFVNNYISKKYPQNEACSSGFLLAERDTIPETFLNKIKTYENCTYYCGYWQNGKNGVIHDLSIEKNGVFKLCYQPNIYWRTEYGHQDIVAQGFTAFVIKKGRKLGDFVFQQYYDLQKQLFEIKQREKSTLPPVNSNNSILFAKSHIEEEKDLIQKSTVLYEYISTEEVDIIKGYTDKYIKFATDMLCTEGIPQAYEADNLQSAETEAEETKSSINTDDKSFYSFKYLNKNLEDFNDALKEVHDILHNEKRPLIEKEVKLIDLISLFNGGQCCHTFKWLETNTKGNQDYQILAGFIRELYDDKIIKPCFGSQSAPNSKREYWDIVKARFVGKNGKPLPKEIRKKADKERMSDSNKAIVKSLVSAFKENIR